MGRYRFIISGGGTGGHIYPAIAIANALKKRYPESEFLFVGAQGKMEMEKVPQAGYTIKGLWISGLQRKLTVKNLLFPFKVLQSMWGAKRIVRAFKPHLAIGTGGYASGPTMRAAALAKVPYVLQEQNSFAGVTNKLLAKRANKIFVAYDGMHRFFPAEKIIKTGNPIRSGLLHAAKDVEESKKAFGFDPKKPLLLVLGGSLGARRINQLMEAKLGFFKEKKLQLLWQCGTLYYGEYKKYSSEFVKVNAFLNQMEEAYAAADIIVSRAGAGSVSELCIVGKPTVFIPSPNVAEDHQTKNAQALTEKKAAILIPENRLDTDFETCMDQLLASKEIQAELSTNIAKLAMPNATERIVGAIDEILDK